MKGKLSLAFCLSIGSALAISFDKLFISLNVNEILSILVSSLSSALLVSFIEWALFKLPMNFYFLRLLIDKRSKFEGTWVVKVNDQNDRPFSISSIRYNSSDDAYIYSGEAYDVDGNVMATWRSDQIYFDFNKNQLIFYGFGNIIDSPNEIVRNFGILEFELNLNRTITRGHGFFVDMGTNLIKKDYFLEKYKFVKKNIVKKNNTLSTYKDVKDIISKMT